jgi:tryptophanyl-tRNA synthetase
MTQFKEKGGEEASVTVGLFDYPVLQAADILLYQPDRVPVGEDQRQHLELARDIAQRFNNRYAPTFKLPHAAIPEMGAKIMDLQHPRAKMSKSSGSSQGMLRLLDPPDAIRNKIRSAVTDSGLGTIASPEKPAITNLLTLYSIATNVSITQAQEQFAGKGYAEFKAALADALVAFLEPIQTRYSELTKNQDEVYRLLRIGASKAESIASSLLSTVYERIGFFPRFIKADEN